MLSGQEMHFASFGNALTLTYSRLIAFINCALNNNNRSVVQQYHLFCQPLKVRFTRILLWGCFLLSTSCFYGNVYSNVAIKLG